MINKIVSKTNDKFKYKDEIIGYVERNYNSKGNYVGSYKSNDGKVRYIYGDSQKEIEQRLKNEKKCTKVIYQ